MDTRLIKPEEFKATAWSGGVTREIYICPATAEYGRRDFICRVSTAIVESRESVFTDLSDYDRFIMPLNGEMVLSVDQVRHHVQPFEVFAFDGGARTTSLSRPNLQDLNLMVRKGYSGFVEVFRSGQSLEADPESRELLIRIRLDSQGEFHEIADVLFKPAGKLLAYAPLQASELAVRMTLPLEIDEVQGSSEEL